jgi:hypothetical protein
VNFLRTWNIMWYTCFNLHPFSVLFACNANDWIYMILQLYIERTEPPLNITEVHPQPRSQALPSCWGKTLAGAGHVSHGNLIAQGGVGKVSNYMLPLSHFTLLLQGVSVLYRSTLRSYIFAKFDLCLLLNYNNMLNRFL